MATTFGQIVEKQNNLFGLISRAFVNVQKLGSDKINHHNLEARVISLDSYWERFQDYHDKLVGSLTEDTRKHLYFTSDLYAICEEAYYDSRASILMLRDSVSSRKEDTPNSISTSSMGRALPKISLPKFSGEYHEWQSFRDLFKSMVTFNKDVPAVEKLHYLKSQVTGEVARYIANIPVTGEGFSRAWEALTARYENRRAIVATNLDRLFNIKPISQKSSSELSSLLTTVKEVLGALESLEVSTKHWDIFIVHFITRRLDSTTLEAWELELGTSHELATFAQLETFLEGRIRAFESVKSRSLTTTLSSKSSIKSKASARSHAAVLSQSSCSCCGASHYIASCPDFASKSMSERQDLVSRKSLCFNCLGSHKLSECRSIKRCRKCKGQHHSLLHRDIAVSSKVTSLASTSSSAAQADSTTSKPSSESSSSTVVHSLNASVHSVVSQVVLPTAYVTLITLKGDHIKVRALLDQGSEISIIRESLVQLLRLPRTRTSVPIMVVGDHNIGAPRGVVTLNLRSRYDPSTHLSISAFILPKITGQVPSSQVTASWDHLTGLYLADPDFATPGPIDIILGADVYGSLLLGDFKRESLNSLTAQRTTLGWIVSGPVNTQSSLSKSSSIVSCCKLQDVDLHDTVQRFWLQEDITPSINQRLTPDEQACEDHFRTTHARDETGRYIVRLPFRSATINLGESLPLALRLLARVRQRIHRDEAFGKLYSDFMQEYVDLGHMTPISTTPQRGFTQVYLPHHGVLRETSSTTKLRVVFNGSAPTSTGISLNDCLHAGPKLQQDLDAVILRWRMHAYAFAADIEKMYRQIVIHPEDRGHQQILWSTSDSPLSYQLTTVTYGLTCAPYLALRILQQLAADEEDVYPQASHIIRTAIYVDDVLSGADTLKDAQINARQLTELLKAGGFNLQKWSANHDDILQGTSDSQYSSSREFQSETRTLGLTWNPASDCFKFRFRNSTPIGKLTKRSILSKVAQFFDPLGWLAPVTILGKMFLQQLWKSRIDWDNPLPPYLTQQWNRFYDDLQGVSEYSIPRWLGTSPEIQGLEFHGFSDASQEALGAVLYIRTIPIFADAKVTLLVAKSKVAPLKKQTIPRLELAAALLLSRLLARVRSTLNLQHVPAHLWVDSSVSLAWIRGHPSQWQEFVANRVATIHELVPDARWHHVAGSENPADCISRGLYPSLLQSHSLWWRGPVWLHGPSVGWPSTAPPIDDDINLEEKRPQQVHATTVNAPASCWDLIERFSSLDRLLRITARILRSIHIFKKVNHYSSQALHPEELVQAQRFWVKDTQRVYFSRELELCSTTSLPRTHPLLRLAPFVDSEGVLRVGGRLKNSLLDPDGKHPAILPRDSTLSRLVIADIHHRTLYGGTQVVLAILRQHFWILGGRAPVSAFIRRCVRCARHRATTAQEMMGSLPTSRVIPTRPFLHSGVDYAGPYTLSTWRGRATRTYKAYLIIFICFSISAVHLDLATDYSTQGFLAAYRRFIARRGRCVTLHSDCGTNFVGADAELRRMFNSASKDAAELVNLLAADGTEWKFNSPSAPHFGGKWEAAVKSTKFHLRRLLGDTILTYEEFSTLLTQIEAVLNSRPLSPLSDDPADVSALTPAHFLVGESLIVLPEPSLDDVSTSRLSRWQLLRQTLDRFWTRWSTEYLQRLQTRNKWHLSTKPLKIGELVLIVDERYPPAKWPLARITALHPGSDGRVRVVTVRTAVSEFKRPIVKLCPLPVAT